MRAFALALVLASSGAAAQEAMRTLEGDGGARIEYVLRKPAADAHLLDPAAKLAPDSALNTARLVARFLAQGEIEEAALLSNAPRERFDVYKDRLETWGAEQFKQLFAQYRLPANPVIAEIVIGEHSLLIWNLSAQKRLAGQFFVRIEDKVLMDDTPNETRAQLRRVLEAYRSGAAPD